MRLTITQSQGRFLPLLFYSVALVLILLQLDRSRHRLAWSRERLAWSESAGGPVRRDRSAVGQP